MLSARRAAPWLSVCGPVGRVWSGPCGRCVRFGGLRPSWPCCGVRSGGPRLTGSLAAGACGSAGRVWSPPASSASAGLLGRARLRLVARVRVRVCVRARGRVRESATALRLSRLTGQSAGPARGKASPAVSAAAAPPDRRPRRPPDRPAGRPCPSGRAGRTPPQQDSDSTAHVPPLRGIPAPGTPAPRAHAAAAPSTPRSAGAPEVPSSARMSRTAARPARFAPIVLADGP